jgi:hypothetical protein
VRYSACPRGVAGRAVCLAQAEAIRLGDEVDRLKSLLFGREGEVAALKAAAASAAATVEDLRSEVARGEVRGNGPDDAKP